MDNYFLVGYAYDKPVSVSSLGKRRSSAKARRDAELIKAHVMRHNDRLTSIALYKGLCWSVASFALSPSAFELVSCR